MNDPARGVWVKVFGGLGALSATASLALYIAFADKDTSIPWWPAASFGTVAVLLGIGWLTAALRLGPFHGPEASSGRPTEQRSQRREHVAADDYGSASEQRQSNSRQRSTNTSVIAGAA